MRCGAPAPGGDKEAERMWLCPTAEHREVHPLSLRCFQSTPGCQPGKVITLQLKIKMSHGREPQNNSSLSGGEDEAMQGYHIPFVNEKC